MEYRIEYDENFGVCVREREKKKRERATQLMSKCKCKERMIVTKGIA